MALIQNRSEYNVLVPTIEPGGKPHSIAPQSTADIPDEDWESYATRPNPLLIRAGYLHETDRPVTRQSLTELDGMHHRSAVKHVATMEDVNHMEKLLAREKRPSVRKALAERMQEVMA